MPKKTKISELPSTLQRSEKHAQETWRKAHNSAIKTYGEGRRSHQVAYAALKHSYKKEKDRWVKKDGKGPSDPQAARSTTSKPKSTEHSAPTAGGKVAKTKSEAKRKGREAKKEQRQSRTAKKHRK